MLDELTEIITKVQEYFKKFENFIELEDFRSLLLFTLTSQIPSNVLAQMGLGGSKEIINIPYNPIFKSYYQKINLIASGSLIIYVKSTPLTEKFLLEKDDPIFKKYLNANEMSLAFRGKEKFLFPKISDCNAFELEEKSDIPVKIDDYFHSLESYVAIVEPNILFVLKGNEQSDPDLIFSFNMMPEFPAKLKKNALKIDAFFDKEHKTRGITYLKKEENFKLVYMKDITEISHSDLYTSSFSLILHLKSLNSLY